MGADELVIVAWNWALEVVWSGMYTHVWKPSHNIAHGMGVLIGTNEAS